MWEVDKLWEERANLNPNEGLPFELFEWISSMVPIPNVDLLILNDDNQLLLSWRDDEYYGKGWHLPGGCIRFKETIAERIQKTALAELGTEVMTNDKPIVAKEMIMGKGKTEPYKRAHHIAMLFECRLPKQFEIDNHGKIEQDAGYLKWFDKVPEDMLRVHDIYNDIFEKYNLL